MNDKKHILALPVNYPNPANSVAGTFFQSQVNSLREFGHTVGVVSFCLLRISELKHISYIDQLETNNEIQLCFPAVPKLQSLNHKIRTLLTTRLIKRYIKACGKPDVIHVHVYSAAGAAIWAKEKYGIPYVITEHYSHFANNQITPYFHKVARSAFKNANACLAVSKSLCNTLEEMFHLNFQCIPNIVGSEFQVLSVGKSDFGKFILNVASLVPIKNHERLINAFSIVAKSNNHLNLVIVGDGPLREQLGNLVKSLCLSDRVYFLGTQNKIQIATLMNQAELFCLSSDYETFGVVLIEALACGLPVVAPNVGGIPEIINSDELGILCNLSESSMAESIKICLKRSINKKNLMLLASSKYSHSTISKALTETYSNIE
ncbi:glycosyltransferase [Pseudoalteromonas sp. MMG024]|uniref:glycosyltransferase n=1 Tax=Pseudoalteromonas sp. MMG024 TaxID=2909980 RepID=UPI0031BAFDCB|nr:glycosyltransferase [Pseudoalteromonas sp. MMG024]